VHLLSNISGLFLNRIWLLHPGMRVSVGSLPIGLLARPGQSLEEILPDHIVQINVLALIPAAHQMVDGSRKINSQLAHHSLLFSYRGPNVKEKMHQSMA
jgi:hypothetical protein